MGKRRGQWNRKLRRERRNRRESGTFWKVVDAAPHTFPDFLDDASIDEARNDPAGGLGRDVEKALQAFHGHRTFRSVDDVSNYGPHNFRAAFVIASFDTHIGLREV
jgi:hypothetical protein